MTVQPPQPRLFSSSVKKCPRAAGRALGHFLTSNEIASVSGLHCRIEPSNTPYIHYIYSFLSGCIQQQKSSTSAFSLSLAFGLRRKKKCLGFGAMLLDIALQSNIYTLHILFLTDVEKCRLLRGLSFLSYLFELSISPEPF